MDKLEERKHSLGEENELLRRELDLYKENEKMFRALVETAVGEIGEDFFNKIVKKLSEWLHAECVIIGQVVAPNVVEGFPAYLDGEIIHGFTYKLEGTPCDLTSKKGYCVYEDNVRDSFPTSKDIIELNLRGYVGTALYNKDGEANGILCAMSRKKLCLPPQAENILRIVGARITTEIERIKAQKVIEISEKKLLKANASKDRLFSIISHDLKNPFNALIGFSNLIKKNVDNNNYDKISKYIDVIHDISNQTYSLLINLLEWSLTQTRDIKYEPVYFNFSDLVNEILGIHNHLAQQKKIVLNSEIDLTYPVFADKNMITTILRNLISNSIKFTQQGGNIRVKAHSDEGRTIVSVSDNGIGIKPEEIEKIFDPDDYYTTNGTSNEKGAGLGLILCKEFVQKHNGQIWVESQQGKGSTFFFSIPVINN